MRLEAPDSVLRVVFLVSSKSHTERCGQRFVVRSCAGLCGFRGFGSSEPSGHHTGLNGANSHERAPEQALAAVVNAVGLSHRESGH